MPACSCVRGIPHQRPISVRAPGDAVLVCGAVGPCLCRYDMSAVGCPPKHKAGPAANRQVLQYFTRSVPDCLRSLTTTTRAFVLHDRPDLSRVSAPCPSPSPPPPSPPPPPESAPLPSQGESQARCACGAYSGECTQGHHLGYLRAPRTGTPSWEDLKRALV